MGAPWGSGGLRGGSAGAPRGLREALTLQNHAFYTVAQVSLGGSALAGRAHAEPQKRTSCLFLKLKRVKNRIVCVLPFF